MNPRTIINKFEYLNKNLVNRKIKRSYVSIGSNVFFDFESEIQISKFDWSFWIGWASWRITKQGNFFLGSYDNKEKYDLNLPKLENECFLKAEIISPFGDLKIKLSNSIEITTFFRYFAEDHGFFLCQIVIIWNLIVVIIMS